mmetsp:Transcript_33681/g.76924  ORF Transcript_33681/g.76924 Transcript_33681/m.76924 type:complete len:256 (+) Transcript_33681:56-823(+)|eukprot:5077716-Amphidinium_carterae.1
MAANFVAGQAACWQYEKYCRAMECCNELFGDVLSLPHAKLVRAPLHDRVFHRRKRDCGPSPEARSQLANILYTPPSDCVGLAFTQQDERDLPLFDFSDPCHTVYHAPQFEIYNSVRSILVEDFVHIPRTREHIERLWYGDGFYSTPSFMLAHSLASYGDRPLEWRSTATGVVFEVSCIFQMKLKPDSFEQKALSGGDLHRDCVLDWPQAQVEYIVRPEQNLREVLRTVRLLLRLRPKADRRMCPRCNRHWQLDVA